jgi:tRNA 2-thiouridine synthesizing protein A
LNMTGLTCPHPLLGARKVLEELKTGDVMLLVSDCLGTRDDLFSWLKHTDNELVETGEDASGNAEYYIRKGKRMPISADVTLDLKGMVCPGPVIEAKKILGAMQAEEVMKLVSTCQAARDEVKTWCGASGSTLLDTLEVDPGVWEFYIRKG